MSFIKKAVKKVFSGIKKIVKSDIFKWVAIASLVFFTAGVAAGGFAAFTGVSGIGSFFTAVGQTIATGASSIASTFGFKGLSATLAQHGGAAAIQAGLTQTATSVTGATLTADAVGKSILATGGAPSASTAGGVLASKGGTALTLSAKGTAAAQAAAAAAANVSAAEGALGMSIQPGTALFDAAAKYGASTGTNWEAMSSMLTSNAPAGISSGTKSVMLSGIVTGTQAALNAKASKRRPKTFVAGGLSRGGGDTVSVPTVSFDRSRSGGAAAAPVESGSEYIAQQETPSVARQLSGSIESGPMQPAGSQPAPYQPRELPSGGGLFAQNNNQPGSANPAVQQGIGIIQRATMPEFQNTNSFFSNIPQATPINNRAAAGSFEDRIFGGNILGVA